MTWARGPRRSAVIILAAVVLAGSGCGGGGDDGPPTVDDVAVDVGVDPGPVYYCNLLLTQRRQSLDRLEAQGIEPLDPVWDLLNAAPVSVLEGGPTVLQAVVEEQKRTLADAIPDAPPEFKADLEAVDRDASQIIEILSAAQWTITALSPEQRAQLAELGSRADAMAGQLETSISAYCSVATSDSTDSTDGSAGSEPAPPTP